MAYVLAVHGIDHVFADVLGVIANTLDGPYHPHDIQRAANGAWIFHHEGDALPMNRLVLLIDGAIATRHPKSEIGIEPREGIQRLAHHDGHQGTNMPQFPIAGTRPFGGGHVHGNRRHLLAFITDALQIGDGFEHRDQQPQVSGRWRARGQHPAAILIDGALHLIDSQLLLSHRDDSVRIAAINGGQSIVKLPFHQTTHLQHTGTNAFQIFVETAGGVMAEVVGVHLGGMSPD